MAPRKTTRGSQKATTKAALAKSRRDAKKNEEVDSEESEKYEEDEEASAEEEVKTRTSSRSAKPAKVVPRKSPRKGVEKKISYAEPATDGSDDDEDDEDESDNEEEAFEAKKKQKTGSDKWTLKGTLLYADFDCDGTQKICGFDMDSTLIKTKSGRTFATSSSDWLFWDESVPEKLKEMHEDGYKIVIFTNQGGIATRKTSVSEVKTKLNAIQQKLDIPIQVFAAGDKDKYRKPALGMWEFLEKSMNEGIKIDRKKSIYVGDAAGRPAEGKIRKKDFSDGDLKFALNLGAKFYTPEEFFLKEDQTIPTPKNNPNKLFAKEGEPLKSGKVHSDSQEIIVFVGSPAAGKSTFWSKHLSDYTRINRDMMKTKEKCWAACKAAVAEGESCVIDNTNPSVDARAPYIKIAKDNKIPIRCFYFPTDRVQCQHLDALRIANSHRKHFSGRAGSMAMNMFKKNFSKPTTKEGFKAVLETCFVAGPFENDNDEKTFWSFVDA